MLETIGQTVLVEGVKFLFQQAGELLKKYRERKTGEEKNQKASPDLPAVLPEGVFSGRPKLADIDWSALERLQDEIRTFRLALVDYATDVEPVSGSDKKLQVVVNNLRDILEAVYGQSLTLVGEQRATTGPAIHGEVDIDKLKGDAAAVRAHLIEGGAKVEAKARAGEVESEGRLSGIEVDTIRGS